MSRFLTMVTVMTISVLFAGCDIKRTPLQVGGKQAPEDRIIAELIAELAEAEGMPVQRRIGLGDSRMTMEAIKRGEIDLYPEYTGSAFALLGLTQPPDSDSLAALDLLRSRYAPLGLLWSEPLGFESRPGLVMLSERARALGVRTYSDLALHANLLTLGVDSEFRERSIDGLSSLLRRNDMDFNRIVEVSTAERSELAEKLMDGEIDVAQIHSVDPRIEVFDLYMLVDDLEFFPRHDAAVVYRESVLQQHPALERILAKLEGAIGDTQIQALSRRVALRGEDPREVVRGELRRLGLIDGEVRVNERQSLSLAVSPSANADGEAGTLLRQLKRAFPSSNVNLVRSADPLAAITDASVRLALVSAPAFFSPGNVDPATGQPTLREGFEAVALVGTSFLHAFALNPDVERFVDAASIATGPVGSSGFRTAESLIQGLNLSAELLPISGDTPDELADGLLESGADIAILMQPIGNSSALALLQQGLPMIEVEGWVQGNNRIVFPYLQPARIKPGDYLRFVSGEGDGVEMTGFTEPINTLVTQLVLAGPAVRDEVRLASQGPGASFSTRALPLTDQVVERINAAIGQPETIYPVLPQARALAPRPPKPEAALNPSLAASFLSVMAIALLMWIAFLILTKPRT